MFFHSWLFITVFARALAVKSKILDSKRQSSITFAIIGPYSLIPGLKYNGSLVTDSIDNFNISYYQDLASVDFDGWFFWNQLGAQLAIEKINANPNIFPNTSITIKKFNDMQFGGTYSQYYGGYSSEVAYDIATVHTDEYVLYGVYCLVLQDTVLWHDTVFDDIV
ncbi:hypothetical protein HK100_006317 [Physocladia obscura]|uniref:Uncharacterized protein n=1 Tax=Physocladia obscura TaxID=109957 RepID=A0AAD5SQN2_9FUNG|nr:hypothetical protein HK100_006317 [Physocladia obscura]